MNKQLSVNHRNKLASKSRKSRANQEAVAKVTRIRRPLNHLKPTRRQCLTCCLSYLLILFLPLMVPLLLAKFILLLKCRTPIKCHYPNLVKHIKRQ